jgi:hypothetical protein
VRFVETPIFTRVLTRLIGDDEYRNLQVALMLRPEQGPVIPGTGGLRKVRWARPGAGTRGGLRIIYYWAPVERAFYMLYVYAKNEQGDLTPPARLRPVVRENSNEGRGAAGCHQHRQAGRIRRGWLPARTTVFRPADVKAVRANWNVGGVRS